MSTENQDYLSPSQYYRSIRPEYFSDSEIIKEIELPKEVLAYQFDQITANQKHDQFESLGRHLAEKLICPNLIPQVGPTGGGDGKTDTETYPVSTSISDRWFVPENGWEENQKWAFAISAKKKWKEKLESDVTNIIGTNRGYTRVYFITNQKPSSKQKKEAQDKLISKFNIDVIILDQEWLLEKIYSNDLIQLTIDCLNLSQGLERKTTVLGSNDVSRIKRLKEVEEKIANPKNYFENDHQMVEDALESALLSRMLEKPKDEVLGRFDRALRFANKIRNQSLLARIYYQRAWTYINWYDAYGQFLEDYNQFKTYVDENSNFYLVELYLNLYNIIRTLSNSQNGTFLVDIDEEDKQIRAILQSMASNTDKPSTALIAKSRRCLLDLGEAILKDTPTDTWIEEMKEYITQSQFHLDYPFETVTDILLDVFGELLTDDPKFDLLTDHIATISEKRSSELTAADKFTTRAMQKMSANLYKDAIIYFGKAILKLAKEESEYHMYLTLKGLGYSYKKIGLLWASNHCFFFASYISTKPWHTKGIIDKKTYSCVKELADNEILIGRVPSVMLLYSFLKALALQIDVEEEQEENKYPPDLFLDMALSIRLLNTKIEDFSSYEFLPSILNRYELLFSEDAVRYLLGYTDDLVKDYNRIHISNEKGLDEYFSKLALQPIQHQIVNTPTNLLDMDDITLSSIILGCKFNVTFKQDHNTILNAEMLLALLESFFATSLEGIYPKSETINISLSNSEGEMFIKLNPTESSDYYGIEINSKAIKEWGQVVDCLAQLFFMNFFVEDPQLHLKNLFEHEEINDRLSSILNHAQFVTNIMGNKPMLFYKDWVNISETTKFPMLRNTPVSFVVDNEIVDKKYESANKKNDKHNERKIISVIDDKLWDEAVWQAFGYVNDPRIGQGLFLGFQNGQAGKMIFENWIKRFGGAVDKEEIIKITVIRGISQENPYWYRVHISGKIDKSTMKEGQVITTTSRFHELKPENPQNLNNLIALFDHQSAYNLYPASFKDGMIDILPYVEQGILKTEFYVKDAWQISEDDLDRVAIFADDDPIIPEGIVDAPIIKLLDIKKRNKN